MTWLALTALIAAFGMAWYPCCCGSNACGCLADPPESYLVVFTGVTGDWCGEGRCADYWNDPAGFVVIIDAESEIFPCSYLFTDAWECGDEYETEYRPQIVVNIGGGVVVYPAVEIWEDGEFIYVSLEESFGLAIESPHDCNFDGDDVPRISPYPNPLCDWSAATCKIWALPL